MRRLKESDLAKWVINIIPPGMENRGEGWSVFVDGELVSRNDSELLAWKWLAEELRRVGRNYYAKISNAVKDLGISAEDLEGHETKTESNRITILRELEIASRILSNLLQNSEANMLLIDDWSTFIAKEISSMGISSTRMDMKLINGSVRFVPPRSGG